MKYVEENKAIETTAKETLERNSTSPFVPGGSSMSKHSMSQQVPKDMQARFDDITQLTDTFSQAYLTDEYASLCRQLTATLCRKRPSPLSQGKAATWACGIIHALRMVNFLFNASQKPHAPATQIPTYFGLRSPPMQPKSNQIPNLLPMYHSH